MSIGDDNIVNIVDIDPCWIKGLCGWMRLVLWKDPKRGRVEVG